MAKTLENDLAISIIENQISVIKAKDKKRFLNYLTIQESLIEGILPYVEGLNTSGTSLGVNFNLLKSLADKEGKSTYRRLLTILEIIEGRSALDQLKDSDFLRFYKKAESPKGNLVYRNYGKKTHALVEAYLSERGLINQ